MPTHRKLAQILSVIMILTILFSSVSLPSASAQGSDGLKRQVNPQTGKVSLIAPEKGQALPASQALGFSAFARAEEPALALAKRFAPEFGMKDPGRELSELNRNHAADGRVTVRYQQNYQNVPVMGGELIVNTNENGDLYSMNGEVSPDLTLSTQPALDAESARRTALAGASKWYEKAPGEFVASTPELWVYDESLLRPSQRGAELVWRMEVTPVEVGMPVRELVLVDAQTGGISLHFNQMDTAWGAHGRTSYNGNQTEASSGAASPALLSATQVRTYTAGSTDSLPGSFLCDQSQPNCTNGSNPSADAVHRYTLGAHAFYATQFNRDSIDNRGMAVVSTVDYCPSGSPCPYNNANWTGTQIVFGSASGLALADDIVAHEFTHGVTQYESNLFYYYQSGAINESFSDLWGEYYDQTNGLGTDTAGVKWQIGENVSGSGALRSMSNPPAFRDPDKMSSLDYYEGADDNGGVHYNSGVNNKAVYLMVDGGSFNSKTVTALGWAKTAAIYYEANTNLLSSGADYSDLYYALQQACTNLTGQKGITSANCAEVKDAVDAVEMNAQPAPNFNADAPYCSPGLSMTPLFADDFEAGAGSWTFANGDAVRWQLDSPYGPFAHSGSHYLYADDYPGRVADAVAQLVPLTVPGNAFLHFAHAYEFETSEGDYFDGGVLEYSLNGGATWADAGSLMDFNGYRGSLFTGSGNPLSGRSAFVGTSHGYISTRLNLSSLAGNTVVFRWHLGLDQSLAVGGWWVDDVRLYQCPPVPDTTNPVVSSILRAVPNPTSAPVVYYTVTFSEPVTGVGSNDFSLSMTGSVSGAAITNVTGAGATYSVIVNTGTGAGTLRVNIPGSATITDLAGNSLAGLPYSSGQAYDMNNGPRENSVVTRMGDFNGDGSAEIAIFRPSDSNWYIYGVGNFLFGAPGDVPVIGDYNGDGRDDIAVFRPSNSTWYVHGMGSFVYGAPGDVPVIGDYNGDGRDDIAIFRPSNSKWYVHGVGEFLYGAPGDVPVIGDYDGDGRDDIAIFRPSNSKWYVHGVGEFLYGAPGDVPVIADYNGDGRADIAVFRPSNSTWYIHGVGDFLYGAPGDIPI